MDLDISAEDLEFRDEVRTWLAENRPSGDRPREGIALREYDLAWQRSQWEGGWAGISWPTAYGGQGLSLQRQLIWFEEYARVDHPPVDSCFVGLTHAGPTLMIRGDDEQRETHLPPILRGEVLWCQGFSEPEAGSDLASLRTRADVDGDELVVTGQKVWTSYADVSDWQELLVRTDRDAPRHKGITWVICDMHSPGIEVRPIRNIPGYHEFTEVFYDEVRVPLANVVGEINDGWRVAMSTLAFERGTAFTTNQVKLASSVEALIELARELTGPDGRRPAIADEEIARRLATLRAEVAALRALTYLGVSRNARTEMPGPEGSMLKLRWSELGQELHRLALDVLGPDVLRSGPEFRWQEEYLGSFAETIAGGTSEIQRNIIGERVLGLPR